MTAVCFLGIEFIAHQKDSDIHLETAFSLPSGFRFGEVSSLTAPRAVGLPTPSLGPLAAFTGTFRGSGFNIIFRPDSTLHHGQGTADPVLTAGLLNFIGLTWPHVSVATLVPSSPIPIPPSAWT